MMGNIKCSTAAIRNAERFSYWQEVTCRAYVAVDCIGGSGSGEHLTADISQYEFGQIKLSRYDCVQPMQYRRQEAQLRADQVEDFQFILLLSGSATVHQDGREAVLCAGDMVMYEASRPFHLNFPEHHRTVGIKLARPLMTGRLTCADRLTAHVMKGSKPVAALAASLLRQSFEIADAGDELAQQRLGASLLDMLATSIEVELGGQAPATSRQAMQFEQVKRYMLDRLDDTTLDIASIADAQHVAPRTIHRLFAIEGTTAMRWLLQARLNASYRALAEGKIDRVTSAALSFGFSDFSHFSRAFKRAFNITPQTLLRHKAA